LIKSLIVCHTSFKLCALYTEESGVVKQRSVFMIIIFCLSCFAGCPAGNNRPPAHFPAAEQSADTVSADDCKAADILAQVDVLLADRIFESHCLIIRNQFVLSIWLVVPELDACAAKGEVEVNSRLAFVKGLRMCHTVVSGIPCVRELFDAVNPMIVDGQFNCWYRDIIPMRNLPPEENPSDDELTQYATRRNMKYSYSRTVTPRTKDRAGTLEIPAWQEFRKSIQQLLCREPGRCNAAAYPMFLKDYCIVQVYWEAAADGNLVDADILERMAQIAQRFAGIPLPIARLDMSIVNADGKLTVYGKADGHVLHAGADISSLKDEICLYHMP
jgi:hypothetical protein